MLSPIKTDNHSGCAIIYTRFSPRKNADTCESCEVQLAQCEQWCADHALTVRAVYEDRAVSGKTEIEGRNLYAAMNALKKGDVLVAYKRDRLARDLMIGLQIERMAEAKGATVAVTTGEIYGNDPSADLMKKMLMVVAEWERRIISERTKASMRVHQSNGRRMSARPPYGYRVDPADEKRIIADEVEQRTIADIIAMKQKGLGYREIARSLKPETDRAGRWQAEKIRRIIARIEKGAVPLP